MPSPEKAAENYPIAPHSELGLLKRELGNPILTSFPELPWANKKVYNSGAVYTDGQTHLIFRAIGEDWVSRLGYASSTNSINFKAASSPIFQPETSYESAGTEDPRITKIGDKYLMAYTAFDGRCARLALAESNNLKQWQRSGPILPTWSAGHWQPESPVDQNWSKAGALFPRQVGGSFTLLFGDSHIWPAYSDNLVSWQPFEQEVIAPRPGYFDGGYIEMGPPPLETEEGWLVIYHGVQRTDDTPGDCRVYRLGAMLLDKEDPTKVNWRSSRPLLEPIVSERFGYIDVLYSEGFNQLKNLSEKEMEELVQTGNCPLAVFCCGVVKKENKFQIYYSSMDTAINLATCTLEDILKH